MLFDELKVLTQFVKEKCQSTLPFVSLYEERNLEDTLFQVMDNFDTEKEAAVFFYDSTSARSLHALKSTESRLKEKLSNYLLHLKADELDDALSVGELEAWKSYQKGKILHTVVHSYKEAKRHLINALQLAEEYEVTHLAIETLKLLLRINFEAVIKRKERLYYEELLQAYFHKYQCEFEAQTIDRKARMLIRKKSISAKEYHDTIKTSIVRLHALWETSQMTKIYYIYHSLQTIYYQNQGQWQKLYDSIVSAEQMLAKGTLNSHIFEVSYNMYMKTFALWGLGRYEEGLTYMATALPHFKEGEHNYFSMQMHHVLLAIYATQYTRALGVITHVKSLENFKVIPKSLQEQFIISEAFIKLIGQKKKVSFHQVYDQLKTLRTHKEGMNINLLILELLLTLTAYDYMAFEQKLTNSFRSLSGHFKKQSNSRTRKFFQLLRHLVRKDFNATDAKEAGRYLAKTLEGNLEGVVLSNYEVVPYPTLWQYCLDIVKKTPYAV